MTEEIRALIFIFAVVTGPIFLFYRFSASINLRKETKSWIIAWGAATVFAFLSPNFWIYAAFMSIGLTYYVRSNAIQRVCLFFVLLPSLPAATISIPGFGLINYFMNIGHHHVLSIILLLPLLLRKSNGLNVNRIIGILVFTYFALLFTVSLRDQSFTDALRSSTNLAIIMLIPFFAISRTVRTSEEFKKVMFAVVFGIMIQAVIGIAETLKSWHLYNGVVLSLGIDWGFGNYLGRNNLLRASSALGHPIALGYICVVGIALFLQFYNKTGKTNSKLYWFFMLMLSGGLISTLSRGPWMGAALAVLVYIVTGKKAVGKLAKLGAAGLAIVLVLSATPSGQNFVELIPFVSSDEENHAVSTISYRQRLMEQSWIVIKRNPVFGSATFLETPEMESMRQGEGIIDVVNSYLAIALGTGLVGLTIFISIFMIPLLRLYKLRTPLRNNVKFKEWSIQNRGLMAAISGILLTIFTTSSIGVIAIYYWAFAGMACAFYKAVKTELFSEILETAKKQPSPPTRSPATHHQTY